MPVYQGQAYLAETLDSLLAQEFGDFELLISDNASTDATTEICHDYLGRDGRIRYVRNGENLGAAANYNRVFEITTGRYFKWVSYDDLLAPAYLRRCVQLLDEAPGSVSLCYPRTSIIDANGKVVRDHDDNFDIRDKHPAARLCQFARKWSWCNPCFGLHRRSVLSTTRLIEPYISSDVTLLAELALRGQFWELPERLFFRRVHARSSRQGDVTLDEVAAWFHPGLRRGLLQPRNRVFFEILRSIQQADLSPADRIRCHATFIATWSERRSRIVGGRVQRRVRTLAAGTRPAAAGKGN